MKSKAASIMKITNLIHLFASLAIVAGISKHLMTKIFPIKLNYNISNEVLVVSFIAYLASAKFLKATEIKTNAVKMSELLFFTPLLICVKANLERSLSAKYWIMCCISVCIAIFCIMYEGKLKTKARDM